ncbi:MAG: hypothetical protein U0835_11335 [Isosphaeraceae bacterium]
MNLSTKIAAAVDQLPRDSQFPREVSAEDAGHALTLNLASAGPVGLAFSTLRYNGPGPDARTPDELHAWAGRIASRVTYLMEPLVVLEHDREAGELEMRSQAPTVRQGRRAFYEVRLRADGSLSLGRVVYDEAARARQDVPSQMTLEVLERLADDLVAAAG